MWIPVESTLSEHFKYRRYLRNDGYKTKLDMCNNNGNLTNYFVTFWDAVNPVLVGVTNHRQ